MRLRLGQTKLVQRGPGEEKALHVADTKLDQRITLTNTFDTLGDDANAQALRDQHDTGDDGLAHRVLIDAAGQGHVQLEQVRLEFGQQIEPGVARAKIVDGGGEALLAILGEDPLEVLRIMDLLAFGHLEHQPFAREVKALRRLQRGANAGLGAIHRIGQEVDAEQTIRNIEQPELRSPLDGLDPAGLIETVAVAIVDPSENLPADSPLTPRTSAS